MIVLGLLLGLVGTDVNSGVARYSFDIPELTDGIGFVAIAMGVFGYGEIITNLGKHAERARGLHRQGQGPVARPRRTSSAWCPPSCAAPRWARCWASCPAAARCWPRSRPTRSRRRPSCKPGEVPFGKGNIRGVAAPESANNAGSQTSFIPLLTLGIPPNAVMALMVGAMTIHNIQPGPQVMTSNPQLFWGLIASMWIGNAMLVILNLPLIGMWIKLLTVPYRWLFPAIVLFCAIGVYSTNNNIFDIWMVAHLRRHRLRLHQARLRAGAAAAGLHPGPDDGREPAPRAAAVARRLVACSSPARCRPACWPRRCCCW